MGEGEGALGRTLATQLGVYRRFGQTRGNVITGYGTRTERSTQALRHAPGSACLHTDRM